MARTRPRSLLTLGPLVAVKRAFGRFAGFTNGWLSWMYSLIDMAIYPVLFLQYLRFFTGDLGRVPSWLLALALIWGATWLNLRGTRAVGLASGWFVVAVLLPFAVLAGFALKEWNTGGAAIPMGATPVHAAAFLTAACSPRTCCSTPRHWRSSSRR